MLKVQVDLLLQQKNFGGMYFTTGIFQMDISLWKITGWNISGGMRTESKLLLHYYYCYIIIIIVTLLPGGPGLCASLPRRRLEVGVPI